MRAARLLQILLLLQNRGRRSCAALATELEVAPRTILRDVDAMTEAGLPIIVHRGPQGGIELGFNYRTRLTGLAADEAEALAVILSVAAPMLDALGFASAGARARAKLVESFPDAVREKIAIARRRFRFAADTAEAPDPRVAALATAVRESRIVYVRARVASRRRVHPLALVCGPDGWRLIDGLDPDAPLPISAWGDINISARRFGPMERAAGGSPASRLFEHI